LFGDEHLSGDFQPAPSSLESSERLNRRCEERHMPERHYALTALQQGMVYQSLCAPQSGLYVQQFSGRLRERLDVGLFKGAWARIVAHHAVLRTRIHLAGESGLCQAIEPDASPEWTEEDWSGLAPEEREVRLQRFLDHDRHRGF